MGATQGPWYVGTQNDALFIINRPPRPSHDDVADIPDVRVIATLNACKGDDDARLLAASWEMRAALGPLAMAARAQADILRHHASQATSGAAKGFIEAAERWEKLHDDAAAALAKANHH